MKKVILTGAILFSVSSHADVIKCGFTEPFYTTTYSMTQSTLTYEESIDGQKKVITNVSFQIKAPGVFELKGKDGKVLQILKITNNGSDGMSDTIYPYEVQDFSHDTGANNGIGGCSSNYLGTKKGEY